MIRLTANGKWFLGVLVALYVASITSQSGLLLLLIGMLSGCFVVNLVKARRAVRGIRITPPILARLAEGQRLTTPWTITNAGRNLAGQIETLSGAGLLFRIARLAPGESAHLAPSLVFQRRGVFSCGEVRVASRYPFGLVSAMMPQRLTGEMVVHPAIYPTLAPAAAGYDVMVGGKHRGTRRTTSGTHFAGVRPLQPGDPLKQIHWKSSAKGLGLMVKTYDEELSGRVAVMVDAGHRGGAKALDDCLRAAGSLMFAALDEGHHVEWQDLARREPHLIPPFDDGQEILDDLARIRPAPGCLNQANLEEAISRVSHKCGVCLVLTEFPLAAQEAVATLRAKGRVVSVYLPDGTAFAPIAGVHFLFYQERAIFPAPATA
jgi:uncharacterized protein (DUF58 family)